MIYEASWREDLNEKSAGSARHALEAEQASLKTRLAGLLQASRNPAQCFALPFLGN